MFSILGLNLGQLRIANDDLSLQRELVSGEMRVLVLLSLFVCFAVVQSFSPRGKVSTRSSLHMGGGRSPSESKGGAGGGRATERVMFKELRQKLNTAAEQPGFFDTAAGKTVRALGSQAHVSCRCYRPGAT